MELEIYGLRRAEAATLKLRSLYETYGYRKYRMGRFEEYSLYAANKSFLLSENVLTFTDLDGRLMAMKPDITLGIAKNTKVGRTSCEKVYYIENVYRESKESHTYQEISQMGLECMGAVDSFTIAEVLSLAIQTLASFQIEYVLKISNMDFVVGLMDGISAGPEVKEEILALIRSKNKSDLILLCEKEGIAGEEREKLIQLPELYGEFSETLARASALADGSPMMEAAVERLETLHGLLESEGLAGRVRLDFSMVNDIEYYNGIIFQGYLDGLARYVLSGGQYDGMMAKLSKEAEAIGFGLYLKELDWLPEKQRAFDAEALILYEDSTDLKGLFEAAEGLRRKGQRVRVERNIPADQAFGVIYRYGDEGLRAVREDCVPGEPEELQQADKKPEESQELPEEVKTAAGGKEASGC